MLLLVQKILYALKYNNFFFRASIFFFSHCQKIIFLPFIYIANKKNFAKLDYLSGFKEKNSLNIRRTNKILKLRRARIFDLKILDELLNMFTTY